MNRFAEKVRELRIENGMTRAQLADRLKVCVRLISYWENGKRECDFDMLIKISNVFNVSIDYILGKKEY